MKIHKDILIQSSQARYREGLAVIGYCQRTNRNYQLINKPDIINNPDNYDFILGTVEFVENCLGAGPKPDYYPDWIKPLIKRNVFESDELLYGYFIKPASFYKAFSGVIHMPDTILDGCDASYWYSDIITPKDEWRLYVIDGLIVYCADYSVSGDPHGNQLNPNYLKELCKYIPSDWCGTIDVMDTKENGFDICECHHPYATGWYGDNKDIAIYYDFLKYGWKYLLKNC